MPYAMSHFGTAEWVVLGLWFAAILIPIGYSIWHRTSLALGITVSVLAGYLVQLLAIYVVDDLLTIWPWWDFVLIPARVSELSHLHSLFTAGFLHSNGDVTHVLGNVVILALVGIPLEARLGFKRYAIVYLVGLFGGSFAWFLFNYDSVTPSLGASGAAFGLLGAYLAGWPRDEIPFPLILIRAWPVSLIALIYFALEIMRTFAVYGLESPSDVAHLAHIGGFIAAYSVLPAVAKGGPYPLGVEDGGPSFDEQAARNRRMKAAMADLSNRQDPWTEGGFDIPKGMREVVDKLMDSGDEVETRLAWMAHLADKSQCPQCQEPLGVVERSTGPHLQCSSDPQHMNWP